MNKICTFITLVLIVSCNADCPSCNQKDIHSKSQVGGRHGSQKDATISKFPKYFFYDYQRLHKINNYVKSLAKLKPYGAKVFPIGKSVEGRELRIIKIGSDLSKRRPSIWIDGGIHAREWISPATVTYIVSRLILEGSQQRDLIENFHWYILPVLNPDGYEYSHVYNRFWRKSRTLRNETCPGVDLNRNWDFQWNHKLAFRDACSDIYAGHEAFSEPETRAVADFILKQQQIKGQEFVAFLSFHSFGQLWLTPWGWTASLPSDYSNMEEVALMAVEALRKVNGTQYKVDSCRRATGYPSAGSSADWAKAVAGIKYSYTVELPDEGIHRFDLPKERIQTVTKEIWEAVKAFARALKDKL